MDNYEFNKLKERFKYAGKVKSSIDGLSSILLVSKGCAPLPVSIEVERCTNLHSASLLMNQDLWDKFYSLLEEIQHYQCEVMKEL